MKLTNQQIVDANAALDIINQFAITDTKANYNLARTAKYIKQAVAKYGVEQKALRDTVFGESTVFETEKDAQAHEKYQEYVKLHGALLAESTEVEKVFTVPVGKLVVTKDSAAIPSAVMRPLLDWLIVDDSPDEQPAKP